MLAAEEITDLRFFGHGRNPKKVVAVSRLDWRITIGQVRHGTYSGHTGIQLDNGDFISSRLTRYNFRTRRTEPVALFALTEQWQYENDRQCESERIEDWLAAESRTDEDLVSVLEIAVMGGQAVPQHHGFSSYAKTLIRRNLYRLNLVDLRWLSCQLFAVEKKTAA